MSTPSEQAGREVSLTDFLLARIAEDEGAANDRHESTCPDPYQGPPDCCPMPARVLAECEAKRRIVEEFLEAAEEVGAGLGIRLSDDAGVGLQWAVRALAAVYSDHESYREEWRP